MQLTENISLKELTDSDIAREFGIVNLPGVVELQNLTALAKNVLQPIRNHFGKPIVISSGFRCYLLNIHPKVKGSKDSQHMKGEAADFTVKGVPLKEVFLFISQNLKYDQLIYEFKKWIHCSYRTHNNRNEKLIAKKLGGKTVYLPYQGIHQL